MEQLYIPYGENRPDYEYEYDYVPTPQRYTHVRSYVSLPDSEIDPFTGFLKPNPPPRGRTQAKEQEYAILEREFQERSEALRNRLEKPGLRISVRSAVLLSLALLLILGAQLLFQMGILAQRQAAWQENSKKISKQLDITANLNRQLDEVSDEASICYRAVQELDMIRAESAAPIHLYAMDTRPMDTQQRYPVTAQASVTTDRPQNETVSGAAIQAE